jgi:ADP-ribosylglycohydrolase
MKSRKNLQGNRMGNFTTEQTKAVLLGVAVGDALGVPVEFRQRGTFKVTDMIGYGSHKQPPGTWSDDTSLTLCLAAAITQPEGRLLEKTAENFIRWFDEARFTAHGNVFDIGISTSSAIKNLKAGSLPTESGCKGFNENGNGSLMRIAPLVFYVADKPQKERFEIVSQVSAITHAHPISIFACIIYVEYLIKLLQGGDKYTAFEATQKGIMDALMKGGLRDYYKNEITDYFMPLIFPGNKWQLCDESEIESGGFVADTLKAAIWCFLNTDNYRDAVLKAVNLGGDTDTTAAVVGGFAGLFYGLEGIPPKWVRELAGVEDILVLAEGLSKRLK